MELLTAISARLSKWVLVVACVCLAVLGGVVIYGVVLRYVFNDSQSYVEQVALLMVISELQLTVIVLADIAAGSNEALNTQTTIRCEPRTLEISFRRAVSSSYSRGCRR